MYDVRCLMFDKKIRNLLGRLRIFLSHKLLQEYFSGFALFRI